MAELRAEPAQERRHLGVGPVAVLAGEVEHALEQLPGAPLGGWERG
ncbi:hypothetical protein WME95_17995 [Sorangium sp. So ce327]